MPSRPALISERDVKRILKGAADAGITMGIVATRDSVTFLPVDNMNVTNAATALDRFKTKRDARKEKA